MVTIGFGIGLTSAWFASKLVASLLYVIQPNDPVSIAVFFFNDTTTTQIYTLSLHDALPISRVDTRRLARKGLGDFLGDTGAGATEEVDRKSTRLNSSHLGISYAVFCLK